MGLSSPTYPGILFIRTIVLTVRAAMFLSFGRRCLARTFQSAKHRRRTVFTIVYYTRLHIFKHSHPERWNCADLSIWEFPRRALARPRVSVDSRLSRSRKTDSCPMCRLVGWTPVWNRSGLRSRTAAGKPARVSAKNRWVKELHVLTFSPGEKDAYQLKVSIKGYYGNMETHSSTHEGHPLFRFFWGATTTVVLTVALWCFISASGGLSASKCPFLMRPTCRRGEKQQQSQTGIRSGSMNS